jgi:hypothetical protein
MVLRKLGDSPDGGRRAAWNVIGEIVTLGLAAWEITGGGTGGVLIETSLAALVVLALYYVTVTACNAAMTDWKQQAEVRVATASAGIASQPGATLTRASWSLP